MPFSSGVRFAVLGACFLTCSVLPARSAPADDPLPPGGVRLQVVSFGDSLSDVGTYGPFASAAFNGGKFTTNPGSIWAERVAVYYGGALTPAFTGGFGQPLQPAGGLGYAQGGARVTKQLNASDADFSGETAVPVSAQIDSYLSTHGGFGPDQLVLVNGGANDLLVNLEALQSNPARIQAALADFDQAAVQLGGLIARIHAAGAQHVVVVNLPDFSVSPLAATYGDLAPLLKSVIAAFNTTLQRTLADDGLSDRVILVDAFGAFDQIAADPGALGFTAPLSAVACDPAKEVARATQLGFSNPQQYSDALFCSAGTLVAPDAARTHVFADGVHPSDRANELFAGFVEQRIAATGLGR